MKKLRKLLMEKDWPTLRYECGQLANAMEIEAFGFKQIKIFAQIAYEKLPMKRISQAVVPSEGKLATESLIQELDSCLVEENRLS